jgi:hypothetical protein
MILFDLESARMTRFEKQGQGKSDSGLFPQADSLSSEQTRLVARQKGNGIYLNMLKDDNSLWELYYITQPAKSELVVKTSVLQDEKTLDRRLDFYNGITPFVKLQDGKNYKIAPTDRALEQLLAEKDLLQTTVLKKISE